MDKWDKRFLDLAKLVSTWSKDPSTKTGAVIVRTDKSVASVGFNGFPRLMPDFTFNYENREEKYSRIIHCEMNAMNFAHDHSMEGYTLYTYPFLSCDRCYVHMIQAGITRFVAPKCPPELEERWGDVFNKVRGYADETRDIVIDELEYDESNNESLLFKKESLLAAKEGMLDNKDIEPIKSNLKNLEIELAEVNKLLEEHQEYK